MKLRNIFIGLALLVLCTAESCDSDRTSDGHIGVAADLPLPQTTNNINTKRFEIQSFGKFNAGLYNHEREILEITDTKTGKKYLGITGVGITEEFQSGKTVTEE